MKINIMVILAILISFLAKSQVKELSIGDSVPNIELLDIINYPEKKLRLSDFHGKTVILDFWSTSCGPCIEGMPKMDSLQKMFRDEIIILPVHPLTHINSEIKDKILKFWRENKYTGRTSLPSVLDTTLKNFFGFAVAFQVWIDKNGIFRAKTTEEYVNKSELQKFIAGEYSNWESATKDFYDFDTPLIIQKFPGTKADHLLYSIFVKYLPKTNSGSRYILDSVSKKIRYTGINMSVLGFYKELLLASRTPSTYMVLDVLNPSKYFRSGYYNEWLKNNSYCYEFTMPIETPKDIISEAMINDLNKYFNLDCRFEERMTECYVIKSYRKKNDQPSNFSKADAMIKTTYIETIQELMNILNQDNLPNGIGIPVLDESKFTGQANLQFPVSIMWNDYTSVKKGLNASGFDLIKEVRKLKVFVIKEKDFRVNINAKLDDYKH